ncbi:MAG TPA: twin-arginine translocase TatA/TatE family subunit [Anaeromyxobacter sp.]|nr:twin-arginine translocase TatA/TatE family subunit [Anaeromyxobacter sp.]
MTEIVVVAVVIVLVLGAMKIPALGDAIGRRLRGPARTPPPDAEA